MTKEGFFHAKYYDKYIEPLLNQIDKWFNKHAAIDLEEEEKKEP